MASIQLHVCANGAYFRDEVPGMECSSAPNAAPTGDEENNSSNVKATSPPSGGIAGTRKAHALRSMAAAVPPGVFRPVWDDNNRCLRR